MKPTKAELPTVSLEMETKSPQEILRWAWDTYGSKLTMATGFGVEGCAIIAMLADITKDIYLFNLETGYQFPEALETRERLIAKYGIPIHLVRSEQSVAAMEAEHDGPLYKYNTDLCCHIRKVVPLTKALEGYDAWMTALRRDQTSVRANADIVGWDAKHSMVKINPLANWSSNDVWKYVIENNVPYNPMHNQGYPSIGCWPCTRAIGQGEDDRSGRWAGTSKQECGIHMLNMAPISAR